MKSSTIFIAVIVQLHCFYSLYLCYSDGQERIQKFQRGVGRNLKPRQLELFLVGQAFSLVSAYARLRLPTCAFCPISPFDTLIFFMLVHLGLR